MMRFSAMRNVLMTWTVETRTCTDIHELIDLSDGHIGVVVKNQNRKQAMAATATAKAMVSSLFLVLCPIAEFLWLQGVGRQHLCP
jgi:hypothetical protein